MNGVVIFASVLTSVAMAIIVDTVIGYKRSVVGEKIPTTGGQTFNNPGNIEKRKSLPDDRWSRDLFKGEIPDGGDERFTSFCDMQHGYRAIARILKTKYNRGLVTLRQMIADYAPAADNNDVNAYVSHVAQMADVDPDKDMKEYSSAKWADIIEAIAVHEQGQEWYALYVDKVDQWAMDGYSMA